MRKNSNYEIKEMKIDQPTINHLFNETRKLMTFLGKEELWQRQAPELLLYNDEQFREYTLPLGIGDFALENAAGGYNPEPHAIIIREGINHDEHTLAITLYHEVVHSLQDREALLQRINPCGPQFPKTTEDVISDLFDNEFEREAYVLGCLLGLQPLEEIIAKVEKLLDSGKINSADEFIDYTWEQGNMKQLLTDTYLATIN